MKRATEYHGGVYLIKKRCLCVKIPPQLYSLSQLWGIWVNIFMLCRADTWRSSQEWVVGMGEESGTVALPRSGTAAMQILELCVLEYNCSSFRRVDGTCNFDKIAMQRNFLCIWYTNGLVQECSNSSALAMELLQSCTKPSIHSLS